MRELMITTKKMVNGDTTKADLQLGVLRFTVYRVHVNYPCRLIIYYTEQARNIEVRQASVLPHPTVVQAQFMFDYTVKDFDEHTPDRYQDRQYCWPHWLPVPVVAATNTGTVRKDSLPLLIEARAGNHKHKINFEIKLYGE